mmetsp:Transcript_5768/g.17206  ORF Transcript_5768/g.17206 Transcript_5768/m.17206 type:complete len:356 (-) Transcript_5768:1857-2924(-)
MGFVETGLLATGGHRRRLVCSAEEGNGTTPNPSKVYQTSKTGEFYKPPAMRPLLAVPVTAAGFGPKVSVEELANSLVTSDDPLWTLIQHEAQVGAANEQFLASELYASVLQHTNLEDAMSVVLANKLGAGYMQATQWMELLKRAFVCDAEYRRCMRLDLMSVMERDPASKHAVGVLLFAKGFHAIQCHRLSHWLWKNGKVHMALYLQSMISQRFGMDIHPAARIGGGVFMDHGTGIVIGETATVGENVSLLHNVTLGGTGKESGDRHPKIGDGVLIGAGSSVLGNIIIGKGAQINARSVVNKGVEPFVVVAGVPAKPIGKVPPFLGSYPSKLMNHVLVKDDTPFEDATLDEGVNI